MEIAQTPPNVNTHLLDESPDPFHTKISNITTPSCDMHKFLSFILCAPALMLRHLLVRIRTPRPPLPLPTFLVMIVIMPMSMSMPLFPRWLRRAIIPTITITTRVTRALITRLVDSFRSMVYAADYHS